MADNRLDDAPERPKERAISAAWRKTTETGSHLRGLVSRYNVHGILAGLSAGVVWVAAGLWSWIGVLSITVLAYGGGINAMYGHQPIVATLLYLVAIGLLAAKAIAEARRHERRLWITLVIGGLAIALFLGSIGWIRHTMPVPPPKHTTSPLEIRYDPGDEKNNRWATGYAGDPTKCGIHVFTITVHNNGDRTIEDVRATVESMEPGNWQSGIGLHQTWDNPAPDWYTTKQGLGRNAKLNPGEDMFFDAVYFQPKYPQRSHLQHVVPGLSEDLDPNTTYTLYISASGKDIPSAPVKIFQTVYYPITRVLSFWEKDKKKPEDIHACGASIESQIPVPPVTEILAGKQFSVDVLWKNGPEPIFNIYGYSGAFIQDVDKPDSDALLAFEKEIVNAALRIQYRDQRLRDQQEDIILAYELSKIARTAKTRAPLAAADIQGIENGTKRIYVWSWLAWWVDTEGKVKDSTWDCRWLELRPKDGMVRWNRCELEH